MLKVHRSATETAGTPATDTVVIKKTYQYFDLDTFESKSEDKEVSFTPAKTLAEAQSALGNDEGSLLKAINAYLRAQKLAEAEREVTSKGGRRSIVMAVIKPFRSFGSFAQMFKRNPDGSAVVENGEKVIDRKAQTDAILKMLKGSPEIIEQIKAASAAAPEGEEETETE